MAPGITASGSKPDPSIESISDPVTLNDLNTAAHLRLSTELCAAANSNSSDTSRRLNRGAQSSLIVVSVSAATALRATSSPLTRTLTNCPVMRAGAHSSIARVVRANGS